jgi:hypothetical protein
MTLEELLRDSYGWADANATWVLLAGAVVPVIGTVLARIGKAGKTDADGKLIASAVMAFALLAVVFEVACLFIARTALGADLLLANPLLLVAPIVCLAGSVVGLRLVFPLAELGSVRTAIDLALFLLACGVVVFVASRFRCGVLFVGSIGQLVVILLLAGFVLRRMYRRAFSISS